MESPLYLAMWSGPRNISTAMLRSWGNRTDTHPCDEPFYAHYLVRTGKNHPGSAEVIAAQENDWRKVVAELTGPVPHGKSIFYQKHMAHHLLPNMDRDWLPRLTHAFLIRDPAEMLCSLDEKLDGFAIEDTGLPQQVEIFDLIREETGETPPVIDSRDVLTDPRGMLSALCDRLGVPFEDRMLSWPAGRRETDGVWAERWYHSVEASTGFMPYRPKNRSVPTRLEPLLAACRPHYETLYAHRMTI
jgi:hypothetical protein